MEISIHWSFWKQWKIIPPFNWFYENIPTMSLNNVSRERGYVDYNTTFIGIAACVIVFIVIFVILNLRFLSYINGPAEYTPVTEIEFRFVEASVFLVPLVILVVIIGWFYSRRNRSTLEGV